MTKPMLAGDGALWIQPNGPNTEPKYLGCHETGDLSIPRGDKTLLYQPDPSGPNKFKPSRSYRGEAGAPTVSIESVVAELADYLEKQTCAFPLFIHKASCGRRDIFNNWDRTFILEGADITDETYSNLAARKPDTQDESMFSMDISAETVIKGFRVTGVRQVTLAGADNINAIANASLEKCGDDCGEGEEACDSLLACTDVERVYYSNDGGATWAAAAANPFGGVLQVFGIGGFSISKTVTRWLAILGTQAAAAATAAYSDDSGATWTISTMNATVDTGANGGNCLAIADPNHIWVVGKGGHTYFSSDYGATWTNQDTVALTTAILYCVDFLDQNHGVIGGAADALLKTTDGGSTWETMTATGGGGDIYGCSMIDENHIWLGDDNGDLWFTDDGGLTWTERGAGLTAGAINDIEFINEMVGFFVHNTAAPVGALYQTINGGWSWEQITTPANLGLNSLVVCGNNLVYAAGEVGAAPATAVVVKFAN